MDLENRIARLELRAEQLRIHLQDLPRNGSEATQVRSKLYGMLQELAELKTEHARRCSSWKKPSSRPRVLAVWLMRQYKAPGIKTTVPRKRETRPAVSPRTVLVQSFKAQLLTRTGSNIQGSGDGASQQQLPPGTSRSHVQICVTAISANP